MSILITGATAGIGKATAKLYAARGGAATRIIISGRRQERLDELAHEIEGMGNGVKVLPMKVDVSKRAEMFQAIESIPKDFADIGILVNNAGLSLDAAPLYDNDVDDWEAMIDTNCKGLLYATKAVVPGMVARKQGHVVNIGSVAGNYALPNTAVYCASKAFVNHLSLAMRGDLYGKNVRVTSIEPGNTETEFSVVRFSGDAAKADSMYATEDGDRAACSGDDIAEIIHFCTLGVGKHVNINRLEVMPERQGFNGFAFDRSIK